MKKYIQILVLVICAMTFGAKSKAQEANQGTHPLDSFGSCTASLF